MTSRQRMLAALECRTPDHVPCAFMMYKALKNECRDHAAFLQAQLDLGLDVVVELPPRPPVVINEHANLHGLPVQYGAGVHTHQYTRTLESGQTLLIKEYHTPDGVLSLEAHPGLDLHAGQVPFLDDVLISAACTRLVRSPADLPALQHLLAPPTPAEVDAYRGESQPLLEFAQQHDLLVAGGWGVGADMIGWLCGLKEMIVLVYRQPDLLRRLLAMIGEWNYARMQAALQLPLDLYIKRAWYENTDFWTPRAWAEFLLPALRREVELAHRAGARFGYLVTARAMPLVEGIMAAGVDVLIGVDPREYDLAKLKQQAQGRLCLWGGINGHLTVENSTPAEVRAEVRQAMKTLAPGGGFILSPVDNVRQNSARAQANVRALIDAWLQATAVKP